MIVFTNLADKQMNCC